MSTFEEQFPSLWRNIEKFMHHYDFVEEREKMFDMIQEYCLDKQKVREFHNEIIMRINKAILTNNMTEVKQLGFDLSNRMKELEL